MRRVLALSLALSVIGAPLVPNVAASPRSSSAQQDQDNQNTVQFSSDQLENLVAPIALYPDPLLSQVLIAATFVDDVDEASRWVRANGPNGLDDQPWDVSVRAVAHYPTVIEMMADKIDWTTSLGQAYVNQSTDVMTAVQHLRHMAHDVGNLASTPQQEVRVDGDYIYIDPYQPQFIYVPVYDPYICFYRRPYWGMAITFGVGFAIGAWLNRDCDWGGHRIFYHGWGGGYDRGWIGRSRPFIRVNNVYVNNRYTNITVNRTVINRTVNYNSINRYNSVHRDANFNNLARNNGRVASSAPPVNNKIINRNINTNNPRLNDFRGRQGGARSDRPPTAQRPSGTPQPPSGRASNQPPQRVAPRPVSPPAARPAPHGFGRSEGNFNPRVSAQRGQSSRAQMSAPRAPSRPSAPPRPASRPAGRPSGRKP
ncbi:MAG: DUF3300 domain-containing protein [Candidatus Acidiferrales bacterium]